MGANVGRAGTISEVSLERMPKVATALRCGSRVSESPHVALILAQLWPTTTLRRFWWRKLLFMKEKHLGFLLVHPLKVQRVVLLYLRGDCLAKCEVIVAFLERVEIDLLIVAKERLAFGFRFRCKVHFSFNY